MRSKLRLFYLLLLFLPSFPSLIIISHRLHWFKFTSAPLLWLFLRLDLVHAVIFILDVCHLYSSFHLISSAYNYLVFCNDGIWSYCHNLIMRIPVVRSIVTQIVLSGYLLTNKKPCVTFHSDVRFTERTSMTISNIAY